MRRDREKALALRLKGHSYNEINRLLGIPKSTLSGWFSNVVLSEKARGRIEKRVAEGVLNSLVKKNKMQTREAWKRAREIQNTAKKDIRNISKYELLLIGVALYWAEGYKKLRVKDGRELTHHTISLTNTDPAMIKLFIRFLNEIIEIPRSKISISVRLFEHINEKKALEYWQSITGLREENFQKPCYIISKSSSGKRPYNRLPYGTIQVVVADTAKFHQILGWIEGIKEKAIGK